MTPKKKTKVKKKCACKGDFKGKEFFHSPTHCFWEDKAFKTPKRKLRTITPPVYNPKEQKVTKCGCPDSPFCEHKKEYLFEAIHRDKMRKIKRGQILLEDGVELESSIFSDDEIRASEESLKRGKKIYDDAYPKGILFRFARFAFEADILYPFKKFIKFCRKGVDQLNP